VDRTTRWGNPYRVAPDPEGGWMVFSAAGAYIRGVETKKGAHRWAVVAFTVMVTEYPERGVVYPSREEIRAELRGKILACWCPVWDTDGQCPVCRGGNPSCGACEGTGYARYPCHRWPLMEVANA
jgi:hypothetical protein